MGSREVGQIGSESDVVLRIKDMKGHSEGICEEMEHPLDDAGFRESFAKHFKGSFDAYTGLHNERLFTVSPVYVQRWVYDHGVPYIESFDVAGKNYSFRKYESQ